MLKKSKDQQALTIKKPNQSITISSGDLTLIQRKAYNALLHNAVKDLKLDSTKTKFIIPLNQIKEHAGIEIKDKLYLKDELESLMKVIVSCVEETTKDWLSFVLVSHAGVEDDILHYGLADPMRTALIKNDYYTTLDLMIIKTFRSKYAVILYELAMRYNKVEIPEYSLDKFKKIMGAETYKNFNLLKTYVIDPAILEIGKKSEIELTYNTRTGGRGGKVIAIKFHIHRKETMVLPEPPEQAKTPEPILPLLDDLLRLSLSLKQAKNIIEKYPPEQIKRNIEFTKTKTNIKNQAAFLIEAIRNDYAKDSKPVDPKAAEHAANAKKCWTMCKGSCAATWSNYKENTAHDCHFCKKFDKQRQVNSNT
jgi:hypothetical protein